MTGVIAVGSLGEMGRIPALDGSRGVAILLVLAAHGWGFAGGVLGVDLFFVLSGFLITSLLLAEHESTGAISLSCFYRRRAVRLFPALALMLGCYFIVTAFVLTGLGISHRHSLIVTGIGASYASNFFLLLNPGAVAAHLAPLWTLAQEEQFYLLWPPALILLLQRRLPLLTTVAALAVLSVADGLISVGLGSSARRISLAPDTHAVSMLLGCIAAIAWARGMRVGARLGLLALALMTVIAARLSAHPSAFGLAVMLPAFAASAAVVLLYLAGSETGYAARVCALTPLRYLARISYGLYLWHEPVFRLLGPDVGIVAAIGIAAASWQLFEAPLLRRYSRSSVAEATMRRRPAITTGELVSPQAV